MKAVYIEEHGGREKLIYGEYPSLEKASLSPSEVLIQTSLAGVNFIDVYLREGIYPAGKLPFILGKEGLGKVLAAGSEVKGFAIGDTVLLLMGGTGSYAENIIADQKALVKISSDLDQEKALACGLQGFTAHYLVNNSYPIQPGDTVMIHAGAGGVGHLLIQLAKKKGATVITTVSTEEKKKKAESYGADKVIIYTNYEFEKEVMEYTKGAGVAAVYDSVGMATFDQSLKIIRTLGTMVTYGQSSGVIPPFNVARLNQEGGLFLTRPSLAHHIRTREEIQWRAGEIFFLLHSGELQVEVGKSYPLADAKLAHQDLENRTSSGKLILKVG